MRRGLLLGATAYVLWGASALYWPLLRPAGAAEILAIRIIWSFVLMWLLVAGLRRWSGVLQLLRDPRQLRLLSVAALCMAVNWGIFIYAVTSGQVIEASLGYFISPIVMLSLGVIFLRERPGSLQWLAVGLGGAGVVVLVAGYGRLPWIALALAGTFGLYALLKKWSAARTVEALTVETAVLLVPALAYALVLQAAGTARFGHVSWTHALLMVGASLVMVTPLLLFGAATNRAPLTSVGLLQYLEPVIQFLIGLVIVGESMPAPRWMAFLLVWLAIMALIADGRRAYRRHRGGSLIDEGQARGHHAQVQARQG